MKTVEKEMDYRNTALSARERAKALLSEMSPEEKMGQVNCYFAVPGQCGTLTEEFPCGVGVVSALEMRGLDTLEECLDLQRSLQEKIMAASPHGIPAIFHMEGLCGAFIQGAVSFPSGIGRGSCWNPELEQEIGEIVGEQERAVGITQTLAPVLDINRDARMGRQGETYGEDAALASALGSAFVKGLQRESSGRKSDGVAKHFLGFHAGEAGIHGSHCEISDKLLQELYAKPFQAAITEGGLKGIMPCYCSLNGEPVSASEEILTKLLRGKMGFEGITVSDYCAILNIHEVQKVCGSFTEAGLRAMEAGMDMECHFRKCFNEELLAWFKSGRADMEILDRAVQRILEAKFRMGLFEYPFADDGEKAHQIYGRKKNREISLQAARESLVLLKNDGVLPVKEKVKKIALIGWHGATAKVYFGGYTHFSMAEGLLAARSSMAGLVDNEKEIDGGVSTIPGTDIQEDKPEFEELLKKQKPGIRSLYEQMKEDMPDKEITYSFGYHFAGNDESYHVEALEAAKEADLVILTLGGKHGTGSASSMGEGIDGTDINLPPCQESFLEKLAALGKPAVGIHFNGRPISSDAADKYLNAIIEAWNPAEAGSQAIVEALTGSYNPGGKLPVSVAYASGQIPVYYNHPFGSSFHQGESIGFANYVDMPHTPRYCFGHGLSYTEFTYEDLQIEEKEVLPEGQVKVSVRVRNSGSRTGDEVVQLYVTDRYASLTRPNRELAGFKRVTLKPGEEKRLVFSMQVSQFAFLDKKQRWLVEEGDMDVMAGSSSQDIRLRDSFHIGRTAYIDGKTRGFYAEADVE